MKEGGRGYRIKKGISFILVLFLAFFLIFKFGFNRCSEGDYLPLKPIVEHSDGQGFSGSVVCAECHLDVYNSHIKTAHFNSSAKSDIEKIKGSLKESEKSFQLNDSIAFKIHTRNENVYQDVFLTSKDSLVDSLRLDVVIGSGTKGQTYLNWQDSTLYQIQVSYFAPNDSWINSPGYPSNRLASKRPIKERCLECHMTYAKSTRHFNKQSTYVKSQMLYGIDCERCHGPSLDHINYHKKYPNDTDAMHIVKYANLSRQQQLDACALCHSGIRSQSNTNAFAFVIGDSLKQYSLPDYNEKSLKNLDVHGNQYGLLTASKCFKKSETMNCTTCHDSHKNQRNDYALFNNKCLSCHDIVENHSIICKATKEITKTTGNNCIQCHMPLVSSKTMQIETSKNILKSVQVRTHFIGIYPDSLSISRHAFGANKP